MCDALCDCKDHCTEDNDNDNDREIILLTFKNSKCYYLI